jgi:hypothetical protein
MKRFALAALTLAALGLGMIDNRPAAARPGGHRSAAELVEVQYRPYYRQDRRYYRQDRRYHRQDRRAERRAWRRERERQVARRAYRAGRRDSYISRRY